MKILVFFLSIICATLTISCTTENNIFDPSDTEQAVTDDTSVGGNNDGGNNGDGNNSGGNSGFVCVRGNVTFNLGAGEWFGTLSYGDGDDDLCQNGIASFESYSSQNTLGGPLTLTFNNIFYFRYNFASFDCDGTQLSEVWTPNFQGDSASFIAACP
jgi:hypothetical protein